MEGRPYYINQNKYIDAYVYMQTNKFNPHKQKTTKASTERPPNKHNLAKAEIKMKKQANNQKQMRYTCEQHSGQTKDTSDPRRCLVHEVVC